MAFNFSRLASSLSFAKAGALTITLLKSSALLFFVVMASGCATSGLRVQSSPDGADVSISIGDQAPRKVGKTPLTLEATTVPELYRESLQMQVTKEGHQTVSVLIPRMQMGASGSINMSLNESALPRVCTSQLESANQLAKGIADSASLVQRRRLDEATRLLEDLAIKFSTVTVIHDLLGNVYYLQRNMARALDSYRRSYRLEPNNIETLRMIERIEKAQGRTEPGAAL